jgi:hypothetical protein
VLKIFASKNPLNDAEYFRNKTRVDIAVKQSLKNGSKNF